MKRITKLLSVITLSFLTTSMLVPASTAKAAGNVTSNLSSPYFSTKQLPNEQYIVTNDLNPYNNNQYKIIAYDINFGASPKGFLVDIGDSSTNDGYGGDSGTQSNDSELQIENGTLNIYASDAGQRQLLFSEPNCAPANGKIRIEISNNTVTYFNYTTKVSKTWTSPYIFALNGQADSEGPVNYKIYAGINRVVNEYSNRTGVGVTNTKVTFIPSSGVTSNIGSPYFSTNQNLSTTDLYPTGGTKFTKASYEFAFGANPTGFLVNIGDSSTNNGYGGDAGTQSNDSELQIENGTLSIYASDAGGGKLLFSEPNCAPANGRIRIEIYNNTVTYFNYTTGVVKTWTSPYIFALNGQADSEGPINYKVYTATNNVISGGRPGSGVISSNVVVY
ncbi:hypothetical protein SAMN02745163_01935 [Clostridium cavendishii DSM 21758]|uniref:Uncharacterized protein n=1 Tax=Clostridium cavendishii DSM 21758 TaxID=1121302 RepID=A0A1M6J796_9CLOT|nr:hypothetical protein [Clostridium cavendishii]SHJ42559.1 hypothetical protein SAMN02745163_01935 [Clostridium cavendishii DSM 21758]